MSDAVEEFASDFAAGLDPEGEFYIAAGDGPYRGGVDRAGVQVTVTGWARGAAEGTELRIATRDPQPEPAEGEPVPEPTYTDVATAKAGALGTVPEGGTKRKAPAAKKAAAKK